MIKFVAVAGALASLCACNAGPTEQEQNLSERGTAPEQVANEASTTAAQNQLGDTMPDQPAGPSSDRGSGTGGDSVPSQ
jgi:hypothetical protein